MGQLRVATLGGLLYVFVSPDFPSSGALWSWDPGSEKWQLLSSSRPPRPALLASGAALYAIGGFAGTTAAPRATSDVYRYDPATKQWTLQGAIGVRREYAGAAGAGDHVYVVGGDQEHVPSDAVEEGDLQ